MKIHSYEAQCVHQLVPDLGGVTLLIDEYVNSMHHYDRYETVNCQLLRTFLFLDTSNRCFPVNDLRVLNFRPVVYLIRSTRKYELTPSLDYCGSSKEYRLVNGEVILDMKIRGTSVYYFKDSRYYGKFGDVHLSSFTGESPFFISPPYIESPGVLRNF